MKKWFGVVLVLSALLMFAPQFAEANELQIDFKDMVALSSSAGVDNIAELALWQLAQRDRSVRLVTGFSIVAVGAGVGALGVLADDEYMTPVLVVTGGATAVGGLVCLLVKSPSEREYNKVNTFMNPKEREYIAEKSLNYLSDKARQGRIIAGLAYAGMSAYYFYRFSESDDDYYYYDYDYYYYEDDTSDYDLYTACSLAGLSLYNLFVPTHVERVYNDVMDQKAYYSRLGFEFGKFTGPTLTLKF